MATRSNIRLTYPDKNKVVFYQHWDGDNLSDILKAALKRGMGRWNDPAYLARIIFSEMVKDDIDGLTGFGIQTEVHEESWFTLDVDLEDQVVRWTDRSGVSHGMDYGDFIES